MSKSKYNLQAKDYIDISELIVNDKKLKKKKMINNKNIQIPNSPGVYFLVIKKGKTKFTKYHKTHSYEFKNKDYYYHKLELLKDAKVLYIGSSKNIHERIVEYTETIYCGKKSHGGGHEAVFLDEKALSNLFIYYYTCPIEYTLFLEREELITFVSYYGCLPLFNKVL